MTDSQNNDPDGMKWRAMAKRLSSLRIHEEAIMHINGRAYLITPATEDDLERVNRGFFVMD
jgi:hypothetical protein